MLRGSEAGAEHHRVQQLVDTLTREHREIESLWNRLAPQLKRLANGQAAEVDGGAVTRLVEQYRAHARFEEQEFLPLAERILRRGGGGDDDMAGLGLSLHLRHPAPPMDSM